MDKRRLAEYAKLEAHIAATYPCGRIDDGSAYVDNKTKMAFRDAAGRRFEKTPSDVKRGGWSPFETNRVHDPAWHVDILSRIAKSRGGRIADGAVYVNAHTKMAFYDMVGRMFEMAPSDVKRGSWSPFESNTVRNQEWHTTELARIAKSNGGRLLAESAYVNNQTKMAFVDAAGNTFEATPANIKQGGWSPYDRYISEHACRQAMEHLFGKPFPSRWDVVKRSNGSRMQLDGYSEELRVAFEYQGYKHDTCEETKGRDREKRCFCEDNGILLVEVPDFGRSIRASSNSMLASVADAIKLAFSAAKLQEPNLKTDGFVLDTTAIGHCIRLQQVLETYIAEHHPGARIADGSVYVSSKAKMAFYDAAGRRFEMAPSEVKKGGWSPFESGNIYNSEWHMNELRRLANDRSGRVADGAVYRGAHVKIPFHDANGNLFEMRPHDVKKGHWSPFEVGQVHDPLWHTGRMVSIAAHRGGALANGSIYVSAHKKMTFFDASGNRFEATPSNIKKGGWSPFEAIGRGARISHSKDGKVRTVHLKSGDIVVYRILDDKSLRIRGHIATGAKSMRQWAWNGDVATVQIVTDEDMRRNAIFNGAHETSREPCFSAQTPSSRF